MRKKRTKRPFLLKIFLFVLIIVFAFFSKITFEKWQHVKKGNEFLLGAEKEIQALEEKKDKAERELQKIGTTEGLIRYIKEKLGLVEEGEKVIYVIPKKNGKEPPGEEEKEARFQSWWQKAKEFFFNRF